MTKNGSITKIQNILVIRTKLKLDKEEPICEQYFTVWLAEYKWYN